MSIILRNSENETVRLFAGFEEVPAETHLKLIQRVDTRRLEVHLDLQSLRDQKIDFVEVSEFNVSDLQKGVEVPHVGHLVEVQSVENLAENVEMVEDSSGADWLKSLSLVIVLAIGALSFILTRPHELPSIEEELKQHVVKIVKRTPPPPKPQPKAQMISKAPREVKAKPTKPVKRSVKRLGALAVLGSMKKSRQRGGVNLGAVNTTAGPGLGGKGGSGGVQTSLYGKGLLAAPVGPGANMKGGGGYGTKGKGGGRAGYGSMTLVGSAGTGLIPLGKEAIIQGGLDKDLIAAVVRRNMGQIMFCYEQGLQSDPKLTGRVAVKWTIGGNGRVKVASLASTTLNSSLVENCILARLKTWKFPLPEGGADVSVSYPFLLRRAGRG
jgi:hypothetical protein